MIRSGVLGEIVQIAIAFNGFGRRWDWQTLTITPEQVRRQVAVIEECRRQHPQIYRRQK